MLKTCVSYIVIYIKVFIIEFSASKACKTTASKQDAFAFRNSAGIRCDSLFH